MKRIVLFASGSGTNAENIIKYFRDKDKAEVAAVLTNKRDAAVIDRCNKLRTPALYFNRSAFEENDFLLQILQSLNPDLIVLAGFLWKIPAAIVAAYPDKIVNIHPALLPKYGGKGMYGRKVHEAVLANGDSETGISIHYVNEIYDDGAIIFQESTAIGPEDTLESVMKKVHELEYRYYPRVIENLLFSS
ncbi:phosphoribosylglycinamide formyltransferase [Lentiprolixibacter aurantiacus]|uniref:Phosphoribosylglycinamide formyltransferase n=1 Tax=Lentiprolixibacter aurantiacus TaxID=2993939 RepID=A0AAE3MJJ2_9FLAO|nr:phosphoribosylglycinamide formyltransferase [Lentiprolixibacter aurantiacus]MCX2718388.1 phosphoribosylglycinamide formyltransferase [Lentiprolixibacter aurantiacus]